jgi:hypothetical protein
VARELRGTAPDEVFAMAEDPSGSLWLLNMRGTNTSLAILRQDGSVRT